MGPIKRCILFSSLVTATLAAAAQDRKPGLYEVTVTTVTSAPAPSISPSRTSGACLTQEMIDKYGAIVPQNLSNICQLTNVVKKPGGMSTDLSCSGPLTGKGTLEVTSADSEHSTGAIHFSGSMHPRDKEIKIEWSATTKSTYKGPDCGALKPSAAPKPN